MLITSNRKEKTEGRGKCVEKGEKRKRNQRKV